MWYRVDNYSQLQYTYTQNSFRCDIFNFVINVAVIRWCVNRADKHHVIQKGEKRHWIGKEIKDNLFLPKMKWRKMKNLLQDIRDLILKHKREAKRVRTNETSNEIVRSSGSKTNDGSSSNETNTTSHEIVDSPNSETNVSIHEISESSKSEADETNK
jgi:E3 ubiquitin-protein ligase DOA10